MACVLQLKHCASFPLLLPKPVDPEGTAPTEEDSETALLDIRSAFHVAHPPLTGGRIFKIRMV
ncbi:hypothetical protein DACRYDRAFT_25109 [Dacryopinax primogenitus]|uniref:Uncharacterized protein n=1 Tax=Dacryopinax primogenitus (strain DJM 731) TaxID=1858805 RepID=M5FR31_DACPD|nr:uncharacterized protein DACRYDRAFT_25109 [Dacryopinax primogenitus]EJT97309.1 hypothetical protein DACRYDRAFT_25109 [Dacryopinax primogenitus]